MHNSDSKCCVNLTIIVIVSVACIVLGVGIYALVHEKTPSDVQVMPTNTTIPRPDLLTKTANIVKNTIKPLKSITVSLETDDTDLSGI